MVRDERSLPRQSLCSFLVEDGSKKLDSHEREGGEKYYLQELLKLFSTLNYIICQSYVSHMAYSPMVTPSTRPHNSYVGEVAVVVVRNLA